MNQYSSDIFLSAGNFENENPNSKTSADIIASINPLSIKQSFWNIWHLFYLAIVSFVYLIFFSIGCLVLALQQPDFFNKIGSVFLFSGGTYISTNALAICWLYIVVFGWLAIFFTSLSLNKCDEIITKWKYTIIFLTTIPVIGHLAVTIIVSYYIHLLKFINKNSKQENLVHELQCQQKEKNFINPRIINEMKYFQNFKKEFLTDELLLIKAEVTEEFIKSGS